MESNKKTYSFHFFSSKSIKKRIFFRTASLLFSIFFFLCGCGKNEDLETYKKNVSSFQSNIETKIDSINTLDPASSDSSKEMLNDLDQLDSYFTDFAALSVPKQFENIDTLADEASAYMTQAVKLYHEALDSGYNADKYNEATENYNRALKRIIYIGDILQGITPDGEDVTVNTAS